MSVNNLRNYNWEQGTQASPVLLTGAEFNKLIALIEESNRVGSNINANIRGWVQVGQNITSYQKYLAELAKDGQDNPLLHVVNTQIDPVSYTVIPQSSSIKEGDSTKLNINGVSLSALKFRITNHTVQSLDYQERTTIDTQLGYVRVAPAQENATWTDVVTIQTCPVWEEWSDPNASIVEFDVTVNAISVSSVTITAPQYVKPTETFYPVVNFLPVNHTKPIVNTLEDAGAKRGICFVPTSDDFAVGKTTDPTKMSAIAPSTETPVGDTWSLGCGVYAFTNAQTMATPSVNVAVKYPYIQFTVTTDGTFSDISSANPRITLQKVDSEDTPIGEPVVLTGTVSGSSLVYTYGNGNVAGDGSEYFKATLENIRGYNAANIPTIHLTSVITEISASYTIRPSGIGIIYTDGTEETYDNVINRGSLLSDKIPIGIRIQSSLCNFVIPLVPIIDYAASLHEPNTSNDRGGMLVTAWDMDINILPVSSSMYNFNDEIASFEADSDVIVPFNSYILTNTNKSANSKKYDPFFLVNSQSSIVVNGESYRGYLPHPLQIVAIKSNLSKINVLLTLSNNTSYTDNSIFFTYYTTEQNANRRMIFMKDSNLANNSIKLGDKVKFSNDFLQEHSLENVDYRGYEGYNVVITSREAYLLPIYLID